MEISRTVVTLKRKRRLIEDTIVNYEKKIEQARADLAHIIAVIEVFEASAEPGELPRYADLHRVFQRNETVNLCKQALAKNGPQTTMQLAVYVMEARGLDATDKVMRQAVGYKIVQALRMQHLRGKLGNAGKAKNGQRIWALP